MGNRWRQDSQSCTSWDQGGWFGVEGASHCEQDWSASVDLQVAFSI